METQNEAVEKLRRNLEAWGRPKLTISKYVGIIKNFIKIVGAKSQYTKDDVILYLSELQRRNYKDLWYRFIIIRHFFNANGWEWKFERYERPKAPENQSQPLFESEDQLKMLEVASHRGWRELCLIRLSIVCGLRRVELWKLNRQDYQKPKLYVETAKGGEPVWRDLDEATCEALDFYLRVRRDGHEAMFVRGRGRDRLSLRQLSNVLKSIREEAGVTIEAGFHGNRRRFVTQLDGLGWSQKEIQDYMGWKDSRTVARYIHPSSESVHAKAREAVGKIAPPPLTVHRNLFREEQKSTGSQPESMP
jgi:integrase